MRPNDHALRREYALDKAQSEGRIAASSRPAWSGQYDRDPAGTEQTLASLAAVPVGILGDSVERTAAAGRVLMQGGLAATVSSSGPTVVGHADPVRATATDVTPEAVEGWTRQLFSETRGSGARTGRITRDTTA